MNTPSPLVSLGEILAPVNRPEAIDPEKTYHILGAHWYGKGLYTKDIRSGSEIQAKNLYRVEQGDLFDTSAQRPVPNKNGLFC